MYLSTSDPQRLLALEPDELGVLLLTTLKVWPPHDQISLANFLAINTGLGQYLGHPEHQATRWGGYVEQVRLAIREAWAWLEGQGLLLNAHVTHPNQIRILSRRALKIAQEADPMRALTARILPRESLHPVIREEVWSLYQRGRYDTAVFEAMKAVEISVRSAGAFGPTDLGVVLMRKAFDPQNGPLTDQSVPAPEREARAALFAGAVGAYKNPLSHRHVALNDPDEAAEVILLASHLLRIVTGRAALRVVANVLPQSG